MTTVTGHTFVVTHQDDGWRWELLDGAGKVLHDECGFESRGQAISHAWRSREKNGMVDVPLLSEDADA